MPDDGVIAFVAVVAVLALWGVLSVALGLVIARTIHTGVE